VGNRERGAAAATREGGERCQRSPKPTSVGNPRLLSRAAPTAAVPRRAWPAALSAQPPGSARKKVPEQGYQKKRTVVWFGRARAGRSQDTAETVSREHKNGALRLLDTQKRVGEAVGTGLTTRLSRTTGLNRSVEVDDKRNARGEKKLWHDGYFVGGRAPPRSETIGRCRRGRRAKFQQRRAYDIGGPRGTHALEKKECQLCTGQAPTSICTNRTQETHTAHLNRSLGLLHLQRRVRKRKRVLPNTCLSVSRLYLCRFQADFSKLGGDRYRGERPYPPLRVVAFEAPGRRDTNRTC